MTMFLLADGAAAPDIPRLILEYVLYAAVIAVGILLLVVLRRFGRLPKHTELSKKLADLESALQACARETTLRGYKAFKTLGKLIARTDKLSYYAAQMSEKERDNDLGSIARLLEETHGLLVPLRRMRQDAPDAQTLLAAADKVHAASDVLDGILSRDRQLKAERAKK